MIYNLKPGEVCGKENCKFKLMNIGSEKVCLGLKRDRNHSFICEIDVLENMFKEKPDGINADKK